MVMLDEDLYARLQVPSSASVEEIRAAYARLDALYSPERLEGGPPEFQQLAARRREELAEAYALLGDPQRRAAYDRSRSAAPVAEPLDFRPLPPAGGRERPSPSIPLPSIDTRLPDRSKNKRGGRSLLPPLLVGSAALGVLLLLVLSGVRVQGGARALATPAIPNLPPRYTPEQVRMARDEAEATADPEAWVVLGNMLYDNMQVMRENAPRSPQYLNALPQWLEAAEAYSRALELGAAPFARADLALSLFYYGIGANDPSTIERAVTEAERAHADGPDDPLVLLNYGLILAGLNPPRESEALDAWRHLVTVAPQSPQAQRARDLLGAYESST